MVKYSPSTLSKSCMPRPSISYAPAMPNSRSPHRARYSSRNAALSSRTVRLAVSTFDQTMRPPRARATAESSRWVLPRRRSSCARAAIRSCGLPKVSSPRASTWSAPITRSAGNFPLTASALAAARASARPSGATLPAKLRFSADSSTSAGTTRKGTPAASSILRRNGLAEASSNSPVLPVSGLRIPPPIPRPVAHRRLLQRAGAQVAVVEQPDDGRGGLLDGAARHVDDRPAVLGAQPARILDLVGNLPAVHIVAQVAIAQQMHAIASNLGDAVGAGHQPNHEGRMRPRQRRRQLDARHQRQVGGLEAALRQVDAGGRLGGAGDTDQDDVGHAQVLRQLAVVMGHGEV